ncbi:diguanylate cyclase [Pseudomonas fluorescens]|uniref:diguanylate cyclase n=1 Tax=Pseudomonas fluorescens TaxID=294 RepID=UPI00178649FC|nr:diguanylate cyclase [Pseudomonas fluorescens]MBD8194269.1 diguanylate cyclase [Pseudomonas fluorescens]MBD8229296.1 diguanylate cyclase [Pseudomonas fluorescens]MBD8787079.1 diguanylate cyclase [Pseudomonas fluorescens]MBD8819431.1 diguanylate cyclase [Pseudomonas fluorescens]
MPAAGGKGLPLAIRLYKSRTLGLTLGLVCVVFGMYPLHPSPWVWAWMLINAFVWPHLAFQLSLRTANTLRTECGNLLFDSFCGGFWVGAMHFNPLPSVTTLSMMTMNNVALGGPRLMLAGWLAQALGIGASLLIFAPAFVATTTQVQLYACLPILMLYPLALGWICYRQALNLARHKRELLALSRTDSLTGLLNHGAWKDHLEIEFQRCRREQQGAAIALIDIDHFKTINDTYGHVTGDIALRQLGKILRQNLRATDLAGRYGGDEFCVILPGMPLNRATEVMDALRDRFNALAYAQDPTLRASLSIGLAPYRPEHADSTGWLNDADLALYEAKSSGRNRVSAVHGSWLRSV